MADTQPVEDIETGNSPCLDPIMADTAEECAESPGQPSESANLDATAMPNITKEGEIQGPAGDAQQEINNAPEMPILEPVQQEPEVGDLKEAGPRGARETPKDDGDETPPPGGDADPAVEPEGATATVKDKETPDEKVKVVEGDETPSVGGDMDAAVEDEGMSLKEERETPAKKAKVVEEEEPTTEPKKVFCEE